MKLKAETSEGAQQVPLPWITPLLALKSQILNSLLRFSIALNEKKGKRSYERDTILQPPDYQPQIHMQRGKVYMPGFTLIDYAVYSFTFITQANVRFTVRN